MPALAARLSRVAFAGMVAWGALLFARLAVDPGPMEEGTHLVLLAPLVLVPLLLDASVPFSFSDRPLRLLTVASWAILPAALASAAAFLIPAGTATGWLTVPWIGVTALLAVWALRRALGLFRSGRLDAAEAVLTAGYAALPGGAVWLFFARSGVDPGPYGPLVVLLTAAHFHYAAFALPVWSGLLGRILADTAPAFRRAHAFLSAGVVLGFWGVAAGIALSRGPAGASLLEIDGRAGPDGQRHRDGWARAHRGAAPGRTLGRPHGRRLGRGARAGHGARALVPPRPAGWGRPRRGVDARAPRLAERHRLRAVGRAGLAAPPSTPVYSRRIVRSIAAVSPVARSVTSMRSV